MGERDCEKVGRTLSLSLCTALLMYTAHHLSPRSVRGNIGGVEAGDAVYLQVFKKRRLLRHPVLTPETVGAALVEVFAVTIPVKATTPLVNALSDIGSEHSVCDA